MVELRKVPTERRGIALPLRWFSKAFPKTHPDFSKTQLLGY